MTVGQEKINGKSWSTILKRFKIVRSASDPFVFRTYWKDQTLSISREVSMLILTNNEGKLALEEEFFPEAKIEHLQIIRKPNLILDCICLIVLVLKLRKVNPDILHTVTPKSRFVGP